MRRDDPLVLGVQLHPQPDPDPVWCNKAAEVGESAKQGRREWLLPQ